MREGRAIQQRLQTPHSTARRENLARHCATLVDNGNLKAASRLLSSGNNSNGVLALNSILDEGITVKERLLQLHPPPRAVS